MPKPIIGILAGMGPASTGPFLDMVVSACRSQYGAHYDNDFPKMMICSQPAPFYHDRDMDHRAVEAATIEGLQDLERSGASFVAIACNSVHEYYPALSASIHIPLLNIVNIAFDALPTSVRSVAVAASRPLADSGLYQAAGRKRGLHVVEPDWQAEIDMLQDMVKRPIGEEAFKAQWRKLFAHIAPGTVDAVIIACLDLSGVVRFIEAGLPVVDAADALAGKAVAEWLALRDAG